MNSSLAISLGLALCATILAPGCGGAGLGADTRADITARMTSAQPPLTACYQAGLQTNRKLAGTLVVAFAAAPATGQFTDIQVTRDEIGDAAIRQCVIDAVGKLKLARPQATRLSISYPIHFAPNP
ncbi:MAG TPA: AgmX/PglI C-terminal domain-containing protein [Kofleriaceae bacterium]|jgi:hypothetical protein|nr:AgmX/PglI C-terminal domain-containing protein [Kofleriaceae bacterium]